MSNAQDAPAHDQMPASFLAAFQKALVKTHDWMGPGAGSEPQCSLEDKEYSVGGFFGLMTPFVHDQLNDLDLWLVHKILGGVRENERAEIDANPTYGNAAKLLVLRIAERKRELERRDAIRSG
jgi:hypothetical protein